MFDESKHPRDKDGKFTDGNSFGGSDNGDKLLKAVNEYDDKNNGTLNITGVHKLEKGINKLKKRIKEHQEKIRNPKVQYPEWDAFPDYKKKGAIDFWEKEIDRYKNEINKKQMEIEGYYGR